MANMFTGEARLQARVAPQLVQHHFARGVALDFDDDPHTCPVGLIANIRNTLDRLLSDKLANPFQKLRLIHLIGDFVDDNGLAVTAVGNDLRPGKRMITDPRPVW